LIIEDTPPCILITLQNNRSRVIQFSLTVGY